jgi:membrane-bound lytic murein transglycosylase D
VSLAQALTSYLTLNLLVAMGFGCLLFYSTSCRIMKMRIASRIELKLHYGILSMVIIFFVAHPLLPKNELFTPTARVWSAKSIKSFGQDFVTPEKGGYLALPTFSGQSSVKAEHVATIWRNLALILLVFGGYVFGRDFLRLVKIRRRSYIVKKIGPVRIFANDEVVVPFSYWLPGQAAVILPSSFLGKHQDYKIAITHELQHHRHGDTKWVYVMWGLKLICIFNPAIYLWNQWLSEIQEFACDETLVDQKRVESQAYARCLLEVAKQANNQKYVPVCATGLTFLFERNILKRRIEKMFSVKKQNVGRSISGVTAIVITAMMGFAAYASNGVVQDRRVSMTKAEEMARKASSQSGFPVVVNDLVLKQLNRYIGTPEGRQFMRDSLIRMQNHKAVVSEHLLKYGVPEEIMAVPLIESGYQNLAESEGHPSTKAAGIWQFIPSTARNYGLKVDSEKDERLDIALLTDAAMRYLQSNNLRFKDWHLSALSYNMGETAVQKGMVALGTRDAWTLIRNGYEGDKDYLPKLMAAILIMNNPASVQ